MFEQTDADHYKPLASVATAPGAKTARLVPQINLYFVAVPSAATRRAAVLVFEPAGVPAFKSVEPSVRAHCARSARMTLLLSTLSAHPDLRKMGLHAVPRAGRQRDHRPGKHQPDRRQVIARGFRGRKGRPGILRKKEDGSFYNLKLPLIDAAGRRIGILVMEIPFTSAADEAGHSQGRGHSPGVGAANLRA